MSHYQPEASQIQLHSPQSTPIQAPPIQAPPIQAPPIQAPPITAPPIQTPTIQTNKRQQLTIGHFAVKVLKNNEPNPSLLDVTSGGHILRCPPEAKSLPNQSTSSSVHEHNNHVIHRDPPSHVEDDIGQIYAHVKRLNHEEKYRFLTNISRPNPDFCYPATSGRKKNNSIR